MAGAPQRLAVIGSGVAGLLAAHVAARSAAVTLYEADDRLGGHADTHDVPTAARRPELAIDTGFIVHNRRTYPTLLRLFAELGVATQESEMSLSVSDDETGLEWAGALGRRGLFPHRRAPAPSRVPADAHRDPPLPPPRPGLLAAEWRRRRPDAARVPRAGPVLGVLRAPLHGAAGRRGVVVRPRRGAGVPRSLPVLVPPAPRDAGRLRLTDVAHRHRRLARVRRAGRGRAPRHPHRAPRSPRCSRPPTGVEVTDGNGARRDLRRVRRRHPPRPGADDAGRAHRAPARGAQRPALLPQHRAAPHRRVAAARGRRRPRVVELPPGRRRSPARSP